MIGKTISYYEILAKLGEGGTGVVYQARDATLARVVALKVLAPRLLSNSEVGKCFIREATAPQMPRNPCVRKHTSTLRLDPA